ALAGALVAEGGAWPALVAAVHEVPARGPDAQRAALAAAGAAGPLSRADLQAALRRHRRRELVRIGGRDLLGLASVEDTVRELSALAEGVLDAAVASVRARLAAEWGEALVPGEGRRAAFVVLGMGKLGGALGLRDRGADVGARRGAEGRGGGRGPRPRRAAHR